MKTHDRETLTEVVERVLEDGEHSLDLSFVITASGASLSISDLILALRECDCSSVQVEYLNGLVTISSKCGSRPVRVDFLV